MKKIFCVGLFIIMLCLSACTNQTEQTQPQIQETETTYATESITTSTDATEIETTEAPFIPSEETFEKGLSYRLYLPNDNADGFVVEVVEVDEMSANLVLAELKNRNVLPVTVDINTFDVTDGLITIDFNQAFADLVCSMGTSGEFMVVGSVVNTFLNAFQAESLYFTVNGEVLESGHTIYDFVMNSFSTD